MDNAENIQKSRTSLHRLKCTYTLFLTVIVFFTFLSACCLIDKQYVSKDGSFHLAQKAVLAIIYVDTQDHAGVRRAVGDLQDDIARVTGRKPTVVGDQTEVATNTVIIGTIGKSPLVDQLIRDKKIDVGDIIGKWESFLIQVVENPSPGIEKALVIVGSDKRGTIYGIYDLSEQIGVSPWYWWADVPVRKQDCLFIKPGRYVTSEPAVKYRGIFINDEEPCLGPWAREKFGGINSKMYAHMFELILRLRGNYLWPAMWGKSIYEDDPESARLADEYGIVLGTSHHEPMTRAHVDWSRNKNDYGNGEWNYATNEQGLKHFWAEGIKRNKDFETLITVGMRGDGDEPMIKGGDMAANIALLERIVADQRQIISQEMSVDPTKVPQMWALYKEVKDYYDHGMKVPDDITLLWCDDNWGNIRRLPTPQERKRSGGAGIYYHFDYVGSPRCYKWINTNPLPKIWEQMNMAYEYGADRIWVVNVGDLKPMEIPIDFFLTLAWDPSALPKEKIGEYTRQWAQQQFGPEYAGDIADIVSKYAKYNAWRKPELLTPATFSLVNYQEAERVLAAWQEITAKAEKINDKLPSEYRDAFFQLVLHPTKASATVAEIYIAAGRNRLYAAQGRVSANDQAKRVRELFKLDQELTDAYHQVAGGKWNHMMAQTHIGYTSWRDPQNNIMPKIVEITPKNSEVMGIAIEGSESAWPKEEAGENVLVVELESLVNQPGFSPFSVIKDPGASGGQAIEWPEDGGEKMQDSPSNSAPGQVLIPFTLSEAASVVFDIQVNMRNADDDSFYYKIDSGNWVTKNNVSTQGYQIVKVNSFDNLTAGKHTLSILRREDGAILDKVIIKASAGEITGDRVIRSSVSPALATLPIFDSINRQKYWIDIFKRGSKSFSFKATADKPWVQLSTMSGSVDQDQRLWVSIDWDRAPVDESHAQVIVSRPEGESVPVKLMAIRSEEFTSNNVQAFGGLTGPTAFCAESMTKNIPAGDVRWEKIPDYGRGSSGMAVFPVAADSVMPPENSPRMEYPVFIPKAGDIQVDLVTGISLKVQPDRGVRIAVSIDDGSPQILDAFKGQTYADPSKRGDLSAPPIRDWPRWVKDNSRILSSTHHITKLGVHTLKIWMVDPGVVLEKIIIHDGKLPESYFGPPVNCCKGGHLQAVATEPLKGAYATGQYRNLFVEAGYSPEAVKKK